MSAAVRAVGDVLASVVPDLTVEPKGVISLTGCPAAEEHQEAGESRWCRSPVWFGT